MGTFVIEAAMIDAQPHDPRPLGSSLLRFTLSWYPLMGDQP
jgi:hypothetical protein